MGRKIWALATAAVLAGAAVAGGVLKSLLLAFPAFSLLAISILAHRVFAPFLWC